MAAITSNSSATAYAERASPFVVVIAEDTPSSDYEWISTLSPSRRSCINLSNVEPCVNRVVSHLDCLKRQIEDGNKFPGASQEHEVAYESINPKDAPDTNDSNSKRASKCKLIVEGVTTGVLIHKPRVKKDKVANVDGGEVINGALKLAARLEQDRQETLESLTQEKIRVESLGKNLDKECERRLNLLPSVVQAEHDELLRDLIELRWHVSFDRRQLGRVKDDLRLTRLKNDKLKQSVDYYMENCPLLDEKLTIENDHMSEIAQHQQETFDTLNQAKHCLSQTEDKSSRAQKRSSREKADMKNTLDEHRSSLHTLELKFKESEAETVSLSHQIKDCHTKISDNKKQIRSLEDKMVSTNGYLSQVENRVSLLQQSYSSMEKEHLGLELRLERLKQRKQSDHGTLEAEQVILMAEMQKEDHKLRGARDSNEDLQHSVDTLRENIALFNKQTQDDEKSVERARRELVKLDEQMGVSMAQFTKVREEHCELSEQLKTDEAKAGDIEHSLRTKLDVLKQQVKNEGRTKIMYDGKVQASSAELDKIKAESKQQADKAQKLAAQSQNKCQGQVDIVNKLQDKEESMTALLESLKSQLCSVQSEHFTMERELGEKISTLTPHERHLSEEMQLKISRVETVTERISVLQRKIEDTVRSTAMLDKMEASTNAKIELLESQLLVLREKLTAEREEERRCKEEFREIADFSTEANEKHKTYLQKRLELLKQLKVDLFEAHSFNMALAKDYKRLQYEFIAAKSLALQVVEKKLEKEESLRDQRQLLALQSCIYAAMKAYYEHRGIQGYKDVTHFCKESRHNAQCLTLLQNQFRTVIKLMEEFLEYGLPK